MPVTVYRSTDASAPVLDGTAGTLCTVLDACLVNGYGAKAGAGWTISYTGTNKRAYRATSGTLRAFLRVQDDAPRAAPFNDATEARLVGYENMTSIDVGTGRFPATATGFVILRKSRTPDNARREWMIVADDRTVYVYVWSLDYPGPASICFGEFYSVKPGGGTTYNAILIGSITEQVAATPTPSAVNENLPKLSALTAATAGHYTPRFSGDQGPLLATALTIGKHGNAAHSAVSLRGLGMFPNFADNAIYLAQVWLHEPGVPVDIRGRMRGFWHLLHDPMNLSNGDTWTGTGPLAGKTFLAIGPCPNMDGMFVMEISDTWERN